MRAPAVLLALLLCAAGAAADAAAQAPADTSALGRRVAVRLADVPLGEALAAVAALAELRIAFSPDLVPAQRRVSLDAPDIAVGAALRALLGDAGELAVQSSGLVLVVPRPSGARRVVVGRVLDAVTGAPIAGAMLLLDGAASAVTDADGRFRTEAEPDAARRLVVQAFGYQPAAVAAAGARDAVLDIALAPAALVLEHLRVGALDAPALRDPTGTHAATTLRPAEHGRLQARTLAALLRAGPAMVAPTDASPTPRLRFTGMRGATSLALSPPKVYLDGVELAQPLYAGLLDPAMIERIEVVRGPAGAALHGSDAIGGVVDIVTRKGVPGARPAWQLELRSATGRVAPPVAEQGSWTADHFAAVTHAGARASVTGGASLLHLGDVQRGGGRRSGAFAGGRLQAGVLAVEASAQAAAQEWLAPANHVLRANGLVAVVPGLDVPQRARQATAGVTLRARSAPGWSHALTVGHDRAVLSVRPERLPNHSPPDSMLGVARGTTDRTTVRHATHVRAAAPASLVADLMVGADAARLRHAPAEERVGPGGGAEGTAYPAIVRDNAGAFARAELHHGHAVRLSAGVRAEHGSTFGRDRRVAWLPAVGAAAGHSVGPVSARLRAAWGRAARPPWPAAEEPVLRGAGLRGNPALAPETQQGREVGLDVRVDSRVALRVTRFDQRVDGLIQNVIVERNPTVFQPQNLGSITNRGWEAELDVAVGPLAVELRHAAVDSRVRTLSPAYFGELLPGDRVPEVPAGMLSISAGLEGDGTAATLTLIRVGAWQSYDWLRIYRDRRDQNMADVMREYRIDYPPLLRLDAALSRRLSPRLSLLLRADNLGGSRRAGRDNLEAAPGRAFSFGVQAR
jgi:iron complex outermembrane recepter protein